MTAFPVICIVQIRGSVVHDVIPHQLPSTDMKENLYGQPSESAAQYRSEGKHYITSFPISCLVQIRGSTELGVIALQLLGTDLKENILMTTFPIN